MNEKETEEIIFFLASALVVTPYVCHIGFFSSNGITVFGILDQFIRSFDGKFTLTSEASIYIVNGSECS